MGWLANQASVSAMTASTSLTGGGDMSRSISWSSGDRVSQISCDQPGGGGSSSAPTLRVAAKLTAATTASTKTRARLIRRRSLLTLGHLVLCRITVYKAACLVVSE